MSTVPVCVSVRIRPSLPRESSGGLKFDDTSLKLGEKGTTFTFDHVFGPEKVTEQVYESIARDLVHKTTDGFNGTIFAYGQTCSGKSHTMFGSKVFPGIVPTAVQDIFGHIKRICDREFVIRVSILEIYNEVVNDLLDPTKSGLDVQSQQGQVTFKPPPMERVVSSVGEVTSLIASVDETRTHVAATSMNEKSSRSHTIFRIIIESRETAGSSSTRISHLNLVDLAGSENTAQARTEGLSRMEGGYINKSLLALRNVIQSLSVGNRVATYRESKLTRVLQPDFEGNSQIAVICTVTSKPEHIGETKSTLLFAKAAKEVKTKPIVNEVAEGEVAATVFQKLKSEIAEHQNQIQELHRANEQLTLKISSQDEVNKEKEALLREKQEVEEMRALVAEKMARLQRLVLSAPKRVASSSPSVKGVSPMKPPLDKRPAATAAWTDDMSLHRSSHGLTTEGDCIEKAHEVMSSWKETSNSLNQQRLSLLSLVKAEGGGDSVAGVLGRLRRILEDASLNESAREALSAAMSSLESLKVAHQSAMSLCDDVAAVEEQQLPSESLSALWAAVNEQKTQNSLLSEQVRASKKKLEEKGQHVLTLQRDHQNVLNELDKNRRSHERELLLAHDLLSEARVAQERLSAELAESKSELVARENTNSTLSQELATALNALKSTKEEHAAADQAISAERSALVLKLSTAEEASTQLRKRNEELQKEIARLTVSECAVSDSLKAAEARLAEATMELSIKNTQLELLQQEAVELLGDRAEGTDMEASVNDGSLEPLRHELLQLRSNAQVVSHKLSIAEAALEGTKETIRSQRQYVDELESRCAADAAAIASLAAKSEEEKKELQATVEAKDVEFRALFEEKEHDVAVLTKQVAGLTKQAEEASLTQQNLTSQIGTLQKDLSSLGEELALTKANLVSERQRSTALETQWKQWEEDLQNDKASSAEQLFERDRQILELSTAKTDLTREVQLLQRKCLSLQSQIESGVGGRSALSSDDDEVARARAKRVIEQLQDYGVSCDRIIDDTIFGYEERLLRLEHDYLFALSEAEARRLHVEETEQRQEAATQARVDALTKEYEGTIVRNRLVWAEELRKVKSSEAVLQSELSSVKANCEKLEKEVAEERKRSARASLSAYQGTPPPDGTLKKSTSLCSPSQSAAAKGTSSSPGMRRSNSFDDIVMEYQRELDHKTARVLELEELSHTFSQKTLSLQRKIDNAVSEKRELVTKLTEVGQARVADQASHQQQLRELAAQHATSVAALNERIEHLSKANQQINSHRLKLEEKLASLENNAGCVFEGEFMSTAKRELMESTISRLELECSQLTQAREKAKQEIEQLKREVIASEEIIMAFQQRLDSTTTT